MQINMKVGNFTKKLVSLSHRLHLTSHRIKEYKVIFSSISYYSGRERMDFLREIVAGPKNRLKEHGFNLDLSYITPRIIAMAYPATGI